MPIRSVKFKLVIPRKHAALQTARDLWHTHSLINEGTAYYEALLLEMRGLEYVLESGVSVSNHEVARRLESRIHEARQRNGQTTHLPPEHFATICTMLRKLYEAIVPSSVGGNGIAQKGNEYLGPLTDPESKGFLSIFEKIECPPPWFDGVRAGDPVAYVAAEEWARSPLGEARLQPSGSPPVWVRKFRNGNPDWAQAFVIDYDKKCDLATGIPTIVKTLKEEGVLPLITPYLTSRIVDARGALTPWDRLAFRLAVAHLLSWETWCTITCMEYQKRLFHTAEFRKKHLEAEHGLAALEALSSFEAEWEDQCAPKITTSMIRHWPKLRNKWLKSDDHSLGTLLAISAEEQADRHGTCSHLFAWLARPENHHVWSGHADTLTLYARYKALQTILHRSCKDPRMTLPDSTRHPRLVQWEPPAGTNLRNYSIERTGTGLKTTLPLLHCLGTGRFTEVTHTFDLAPTAQVRKGALSRQGKTTTLTYENQTGEVFCGVLKSADLLFDWHYLRARKAHDVSRGDIGRVFLKVAVDVNPILPEGWSDKGRMSANHFLSAIGHDKHAGHVTPGLRVLSVILGIQSFATCSVFELTEEKPDDSKLYYCTDTGLWAVHERSFVLRLRGENISDAGKEWRRCVAQEVFRLHCTLKRLRMYIRLKRCLTKKARSHLLKKMDSSRLWPFEAPLLYALKAGVTAEQQEWVAIVSEVIRSFTSSFGLTVSRWRRDTSIRRRSKFIGNSLWGLHHLIETRRFIVNWTLVGGDGTRDRKGTDGVGVAAQLQKHIDGIKDNRLKTGADLIVQAARGYVQDKHLKWQQKHKPCQLVLFEDRPHFKTKADTVGQEKLLIWAHRHLPRVVKMQGEVYGIKVCDIGGAFTSCYHGATNIPGIRCHPLTPDDLASESLKQTVTRDTPTIDWKNLKAGDLVPVPDGELFVCLSKGFTSIHAGINSAQSLHRRFWTRYADPFWLVCNPVKLNGQEGWLPKIASKRLLGGLGGYGWLIPCGDNSAPCRWEALTYKQWKMLGGDVVEGEHAAIPGFDEIDYIEASSVTVYFRDPSGKVLPGGSWYPAKTFWDIVKAKTVESLKSS
jgi:hypothetical protein